MKRIGGNRRKTRKKLRIGVKNKGKLPITKYLQKFNNGDKVILSAYPGYQKGMYHPRFHGKMGEVNGMQGKNYFVQIKDGKVKKDVLVHPVHLKKR